MLLVPQGKGVSFGDGPTIKTEPKVVLVWLVHPSLGQFLVYLSRVLLGAGWLPNLVVTSLAVVANRVTHRPWCRNAEVPPWLLHPG